MLTTIIIFIIILGILVFVHEFGHFIVAKKSGMVVEEFGFGFPPRIAGIQKVDGKWKWVWSRRTPLPNPPHQGEGITPNADPPVPPPGWGRLGGGDTTIYSINAIPLGGFVRILGENNEHENHPGSFINKPFWPRFFTLVAGVLMNVVLAWGLLSAGYIIGLPVAVDSPTQIPAHSTFSQPQIAILNVTKDLPAAKAGIMANDIIVSIDSQTFSDTSSIIKYVTDHAGQQIIFTVHRAGQSLSYKVTPSKNPPQGEGPTGIELSLIGKLKYPFYLAIWEGGKATKNGLEGIVVGLYSLFTGHVGFSSLGGPVKIAKLTGEVAGLGLIYLLQFTAFLSLNLAVLNILPFPALDGGRVLFLLIEKIRRKRNNQRIEQIVNTAGFVFLLLLMAAVTVNDIIRQ